MKLKRLFFLILGCVCLALGCVGIVLPVLPTVPFFLATVFCFANSSEKLHTWFLGTELYQKHLDSFVKKKGMTAQTKAGILMSVTLLMAVGFFLMLRKALYIPCTTTSCARSSAARPSTSRSRRVSFALSATLTSKRSSTATTTPSSPASTA